MNTAMAFLLIWLGAGCTACAIGKRYGLTPLMALGAVMVLMTSVFEF